MGEREPGHPYNRLTEFIAGLVNRTNTRIQTTEMFRVMSRAELFGELGVRTAQIHAKIFREHAVSLTGLGRREAVQAMEQPGLRGGDNRPRSFVPGEYAHYVGQSPETEE